jgi:hypothetical protein
VVAEAEIALASRDLGFPANRLGAARTTLERCGDRVNAAHAWHLEARRLLLLGQFDAAERALAAHETALPPALTAVREMVAAGLAMRRLHMTAARAALLRAGEAARMAAIPALIAEVAGLATAMTMPVARLVARGAARPVLLDDIAALFASGAVVVDACRHVVRKAGIVAPLATRPVLFALARALGEAWPADVPRHVLVAHAFGGKEADDSHRARLRVEIGRLRVALRGVAEVDATRRGFALTARGAVDVVVLAPLVEERHAAVLALLADGESWSSSALAQASGASTRTVQRALESLAACGRAQSFGQGRARRWIGAPVPGFPTALLLPGPVPGG